MSSDWKPDELAGRGKPDAGSFPRQPTGRDVCCQMVLADNLLKKRSPQNNSEVILLYIGNGYFANLCFLPESIRNILPGYSFCRFHSMKRNTSSFR